jgi:uncharacterized protein with HEPN domain
MKGKIGDNQRILHIQEAIMEITSYTSGIDLSKFKSNSMIRFATIKQIEIIGEAAKNITEETRNQYPDVAWKEISDLRNILVHEYFGIDMSLIWQIVQSDIPDLKQKLEK